MAKLIEEFQTKNGNNVSVYDLGNYTFEFNISKGGSGDQKFTFHGAQAGISDANSNEQNDEKYNEEQREAINIFRQLQDKKGY